MARKFLVPPLIPLLGFVVLLGFTRQSQGRPSGPDNTLTGVFHWVKDSGGGAPKAKAVVALDFDRSGSVTAVASQPGEEWTSDGTYTIKDGRIDLDLSEVGWKAQSKPFTLESGTLTLPFQVLNEKAGSSTWRRIEPTRLPGPRALAAFDEAIREGLNGEAAQDRVISLLRAEYGAAAVKDPAREPTGAGPRAAFGQSSGPIIEVDKDYRNLYLRYDDGGPYETIMLRNFLIDKPVRQPIPLKMHPIGGDPRTQRQHRPTNPADNPKKLLAWILTPNWNRYFYHYNGPVFAADGAERTVKVSGKSDCSKNYGVDPDYEKKVLEWAGYEVRTARDTAVTIKKIVEALRDEPGVLIHSGHGTLSDRGLQTTLSVVRKVPVYMTGILLYDYWESFDKEKEKEIPVFRDALRKRLDEQVETVKEYFPDLPEIGDERRYEILERYFRCLWMPLSGNAGQLCLGFTSDFLALVRAHDHLDFGHSMVFYSSCDSATNAEGALALRPKVYFGFIGTVYIRAAARLEKYLLAALARPSVSAREAYTRAFIVLGNQVWFHPEDQHLANLIMAGPNGILAFKAFGDELAPPRKDLDAGLAPAPYTPYNSVTFWLMFMNRWASKLEDGGAAIERCYETFWKAMKRPQLADAFCQQGIVGGHFPDEQEVADATLAVTGKSKYRDKPFNGRFTLNDGPVRPSLNPPPWDKKK